MNSKVAKTMLALCIIYLIGFYVLKFFFPELLLQTITSEPIKAIDKFLNSWIGFSYIVAFIFGCLTFYLFACASSGKFKFHWAKLLTIAVFNIVLAVVLDFLPGLYTHTSIVFMLITAWVCDGKLPYTVISFTIHGYLSQFLLSIRGFETIILADYSIGAISCFVLTTEAYIWLCLLAIIFYIKENKKDEQMVSTLH